MVHLECPATITRLNQSVDEFASVSPTHVECQASNNPSQIHQSLGMMWSSISFCLKMVFELLHSCTKINQMVCSTAFVMPYRNRVFAKKHAVSNSLFFCKQAAKTSGIIERTLMLTEAVYKKWIRDSGSFGRGIPHTTHSNKFRILGLWMFSRGK